MEQHHKLALADGKLLKDMEQYRRLIGRLIYLSVTQPDLAYHLSVYAQRRTLGGNFEGSKMLEKEYRPRDTITIH